MPRGRGVCFVVGVLARAIKHILLPWTGKNSCCGVQVEAPAHVVPDLASGLRWRRAKTHWRSEAPGKYKQILFTFKTGQGLNGDL